jgi:hypothetical protein
MLIVVILDTAGPYSLNPMCVVTPTLGGVPKPYLGRRAGCPELDHSQPALHAVDCASRLGYPCLRRGNMLGELGAGRSRRSI